MSLKAIYVRLQCGDTPCSVTDLKGFCRGYCGQGWWCSGWGHYCARITLAMGSANEKRRYYVRPFLIGWAHTQNNSLLWCHMSMMAYNTTGNSLFVELFIQEISKSASLALWEEINLWLVDSLHKGPVTTKMSQSHYSGGGCCGKC